MKKEKDIKKQLLKEFEEKVKFNVYDMSNDEVNIISLMKKILNKFLEMKIKFKHESQTKLVVIYNTMKKCLNDCFDCLIYPNNRFADLSLRIFMENLIIISFLLQNDKRFSDNWFYWSMVSKKYIKPDCFDFMVEFTTWREKAMADIAIMMEQKKYQKYFVGNMVGCFMQNAILIK